MRTGKYCLQQSKIRVGALLGGITVFPSDDSVRNSERTTKNSDGTTLFSVTSPANEAAGIHFTISNFNGRIVTDSDTVT